MAQQPRSKRRRGGKQGSGVPNREQHAGGEVGEARGLVPATNSGSDAERPLSEEGLRKARRKQEELDGKGVRLRGRIAARVAKQGSAKDLHLTRMIIPGESVGVQRGEDASEEGNEDGKEEVDEEEEEEGWDEGDDDSDGEEELLLNEENGSGAASDKQAKPPPVYNAEAMHEKLEDFAWCDGAEWIETLAVTHDDVTAEQVDVNDDLAREVALYSQAAECAKVALLRLRALGVPVVRPKDFYAEMVKDDKHMGRVQGRLLERQQELEQKEERRKQREAKKYSKEVQAEKQRERQRAKKEEIQTVEKWRKMRQKSGFEGEGGDLPLGLEDGEGEGEARGSKGASRGRGGRSQPGAGKSPGQRGMSKKRQLKDVKFGFGGRKRLSKQNDEASAADMDGFRPGKHQAKGRGQAMGKRKAVRFGKERRQKMTRTK